MKLLSSAVCAVALLSAGGVMSGPALARPLHVVVRGANPIYPPGYGYGDAYGFDYDAGTDPMTDLYGYPFERGYWPAGKFPDYRYYGPPAVDLVLARTLDRNGESILDHIMNCQASFPSYNSATNFYIGRHGQPMTCYR